MIQLLLDNIRSWLIDNKLYWTMRLFDEVQFRALAAAGLSFLIVVLLGPRVIVTLTKNRSTMISCRAKKGVVYLRIHAIFTEAPEDVIVAAVHYVAGSRTSARDDAKIDAYIERHREVVKRPAKEAVLQPHGEPR